MLANRSQLSEICLLGLFLGAPLLILGMLLYAVSVIRDLRRHNILGSNSEKAESQRGNARIN